MTRCGIYKIQSIIKPERIYIGSTVDFIDRRKGHLFNLRHNNHHSPKLQHHYSKYGERDLKFSLILSCDKDLLLVNEQFFIDAHSPWFNISHTAGSNKGLPLTEEHRRNKSNVTREWWKKRKECVS